MHVELHIVTLGIQLINIHNHRIAAETIITYQTYFDPITWIKMNTPERATLGLEK